MRRILIFADDVAIESLLFVFTKHLGHEPVVLGSGEAAEAVEGDLLLVDATAPVAMARAAALRRGNAGIPVVAIGLDRFDPGSLGLRPNEVVGKPFGLSELADAIARCLPQA